VTRSCDSLRQRDPHVGRLQIAVNDTRLVRRLEPLGDLPTNLERLLHGHGPAREPFSQCFARHEPEREEVDLPSLIDPVDLRDARMVEARERLRFALEPLEPLLVRRELLGQDLDRDLAREPGVARAIDLPHRAGAERAQDLVACERLSGDEGHAGSLARGDPPFLRRPFDRTLEGSSLSSGCSMPCHRRSLPTVAPRTLWQAHRMGTSRQPWDRGWPRAGASPLPQHCAQLTERAQRGDAPVIDDAAPITGRLVASCTDLQSRDRLPL
jgi:hypothetical protein